MVISIELSPILRPHIIREAISAVLGLGHGGSGGSDSFFSPASMANTEFNEADGVVIQILYDRRVRTRMSL